MAPDESTLAIVAVAGPTYGIKTRDIGVSAGCNLNLLWEVRRFHADEIKRPVFQSPG